MRHNRLVTCLGVAAAIAMVLAGCAGGPTATSSPAPTAAPAATPTVTPSPQPTTGAALLHTGQLAAGDYATNDFVPTLGFTLPDGWKAYFPDDEDEIALGGPGVDMNITRPTRVLDPGVTDAPEDIAAWLLDHPTLDAGPATTVAVGGIEGRSFDIAAPSAETDLFFYPTGTMRIPPGIPAHFIVLPMEGADLVFVIFPVGGSLADAVAATNPIVDSLTIAN